MTDVKILFGDIIAEEAAKGTFLVRNGDALRHPYCDTLYAGVCEASIEGVASLLGVSELVARRALRGAGKFVPVPRSEHDEPAPMYIAVITPEIKKRYGETADK
jgi:hypothetical protein